jgi:hypothetical protein
MAAPGAPGCPPTLLAALITALRAAKGRADMTYLDPAFAADADPLEGLDATDEERAAFYEALAEEGLAGYPGAGAPAADKLAFYESRAAADEDEWAAATGGGPGR